LLGKRFKRPGKVRHHDPLAGNEALSSRPVNGATFLGVPEDDVDDRVQVCLRPVQLDALAGRLDRRLEERLPGALPEDAVCRLEPDRRTRHGTRGRADAEDLRCVAVELDVDLFHLGRLAGAQAASRKLHEEVQQPVGSVARAVDEHEAAAARTGERALGHPRHRGRRDARIDGVPAFPENLGARFRGQRMARCNRATHGRSVVEPPPRVSC